MIQYNSDPGPSEKFTLNRHQNLFRGGPPTLFNQDPTLYNRCGADFLILPWLVKSRDFFLGYLSGYHVSRRLSCHLPSPNLLVDQPAYIL